MYSHMTNWVSAKSSNISEHYSTDRMPADVSMQYLYGVRFEIFNFALQLAARLVFAALALVGLNAGTVSFTAFWNRERVIRRVNVPFIFCILISNLKLTKHFEYSY